LDLSAINAANWLKDVNTALQPNGDIVVREVKKGQELLTDYGEAYWTRFKEHGLPVPDYLSGKPAREDGSHESDEETETDDEMQPEGGMRHESVRLRKSPCDEQHLPDMDDHTDHPNAWGTPQHEDGRGEPILAIASGDHERNNAVEDPQNGDDQGTNGEGEGILRIHEEPEQEQVPLPKLLALEWAETRLAALGICQGVTDDNMTTEQRESFTQKELGKWLVRCHKLAPATYSEVSIRLRTALQWKIQEMGIHGVGIIATQGSKAAVEAGEVRTVLRKHLQRFGWVGQRRQSTAMEDFRDAMRKVVETDKRRDTVRSARDYARSYAKRAIKAGIIYKHLTKMFEDLMADNERGLGLALE
jgi:hypothetical protein